MRLLTVNQYSATISTIALLASAGSLYVAKQSHDLSVAKEMREFREKMPAVDLQIRPVGASSASIMISITNRADVNIAPWEMTVEHSFEAGDLYLSSPQQSVEELRPSMSIQSMGVIRPKGTSTMKATLSGTTDGSWNSLTPGLELQFSIRVRFADEHDTIRSFNFVRRILQ